MSCQHCRFHRYVHVTSSGCWIWTGSFYTQSGRPTYGQFWLGGQRTSAHRASYLLHVGPVPDGLDVMHSCDIKACVNPAHLSAGTRRQNLLDGFAANPGVCAGERNGRARLTWPQVREMRTAHRSGVSRAALAREYGVTEAAVGQIVRGLRWREPAQAKVSSLFVTPLHPWSGGDAA